jgi:hypothetical protein
MVINRVKPRGPFYACKHARTHARVFVDIRAGIPAKMVVVIWPLIRWRKKQPVVRPRETSPPGPCQCAVSFIYSAWNNPQAYVKISRGGCQLTQGVPRGTLVHLKTIADTDNNKVEHFYHVSDNWDKKSLSVLRKSLLLLEGLSCWDMQIYFAFIHLLKYTCTVSFKSK